MWSCAGAEVEPQEGVYAGDALDAQYGFRDLRARGIHLVVRFVCDVPGQESHMDIPDWLYAQTGDGSWQQHRLRQGLLPGLQQCHVPGRPPPGACRPGRALWQLTALSPMWSWGAWATGASGISRPGRGWSPCPARPSGTNTSRTMRPRSPRQSCSCGGHSTSRRPTAWAFTTI